MNILLVVAGCPFTSYLSRMHLSSVCTSAGATSHEVMILFHYFLQINICKDFINPTPYLGRNKIFCYLCIRAGA